MILSQMQKLCEISELNKYIKSGEIADHFMIHEALHIEEGVYGVTYCGSLLFGNLRKILSLFIMNPILKMKMYPIISENSREQWCTVYVSQVFLCDLKQLKLSTNLKLHTEKQVVCN